MVQCTNKVIMVFGKCKKRKTSSLHPGQFRPSRKGNRILEALTYEIRGTQIDKKCRNTEYRERPSNINLSCFMRRVVHYLTSLGRISQPLILYSVVLKTCQKSMR